MKNPKNVFKARIDLCQSLLKSDFGANRRAAVIANSGNWYFASWRLNRVISDPGNFSRRSVDDALRIEAATCQRAQQIMDGLESIYNEAAEKGIKPRVLDHMAYYIKSTADSLCTGQHSGVCIMISLVLRMASGELELPEGFGPTDKTPAFSG